MLYRVTIGGDTYGPSVLWRGEYVAHLCVDAVNKLFGKGLTEERLVGLDFDYFISIIVFDRFYPIAVVAGVGCVLIGRKVIAQSDFCLLVRLGIYRDGGDDCYCE